MKPITFHPLPVLVGLVLAGVSVVLAGAAQAPGVTRPIPVHDVRLVGEIPAEWWTFVELGIYTVPADRWFVVTSLDLGPFSPGDIQADGQSMRNRLDPLFYGAQNLNGSYAANGTRVTFAPGTVLSATGNQFHLWGYLEPVR